MGMAARRITLNMGKKFRDLARWPAYVAVACLVAWPATATSGEKNIMGWVEYVRIEPVDFFVKAKLDTGAKTSSMHAEDIETFKKNGDTWVRFTFESKDYKDLETNDKVEERRITFERKRVRKVVIKRHNSDYQERHVVEMELCINGKVHKEQFSLIDRSRFLYPVLLGRRALKDIALVDASETFLTTPDCGKDEDDDKDD